MTMTEQPNLADAPLKSNTPTTWRRYLSPTFLKNRLAEKGLYWCLKKTAWLPVRLLYRLANKFPGLRVEHVSRKQALAWMFYPRLLRCLCLIKGYWGRESRAFSRDGFIQGVLSAPVAQRLLRDTKAMRGGPIIAGDCDEAYIGWSGLGPKAKQISANFSFLTMEECPAEIVQSMLQELKQPIADALGVPWRVVNIKSWRTNPFTATDFGMNSWHLDGFPFSALKIMIYVSGASKATGSTEMRLRDGSSKVIEGPEGTWLLFKNSELLHRGTAPQLPGHVRTILDITITPAWQFGVDPVYAGLNASFPAYPWGQVSGRRASFAKLKQAA
jgi:hypothetical protein